MPVSTKKPVAIKVDKKKKVPKSSIADGNYKVSAVCEPDENEDFEKGINAIYNSFSDEYLNVVPIKSTSAN